MDKVGILCAIVLVMGASAWAGPIGGLTVTGTGLSGAGWDVVSDAFDEDVDAFTDRTHEWNGDSGQPTIAALGLVGADYIKTANNDRSPSDLQAEITLTQSANLYVFIDDRINPGNVANIFNGNPFTYIGNKIGVDEGGNGMGAGVSIDNNANIYLFAGAPAGTVTLGAQGQGSSNNYGVAAVAAPAIAQATMADAHVDIGPAAHDTQSGHVPVHGSNSGTDGANLAATPVTVDGTTFTVAIDNVDAAGTPTSRGIDWRDRGNSTNSAQDLVDLGEDFIKNNDGVIRLTVGDLPAGMYDMTSYHRDPENSQSDQIEIFVDTGDGAGFINTGAVGTADGDIGAVNDLTTANILATTAEFSFEADGVNPVVIVFDGRASNDNETPLNGFRLQQQQGEIPEPATMALLGLAACGLGGYVRRRRA